MPELSAPDATASRAPRGLTCTEPVAARPRARARGTPRAKVDAVATRGRLAPRPRSEYAPQETPAAIINAAPAGSGALSPGRTSATRPAMAVTRPAHSGQRSRSPRRSAQASIVAWTATKRRSAPGQAREQRAVDEEG